MIFSRDYLRRTRLQKLHTFGENWYVFRDDELSFSISGSKVRKYSTLLPFLCEKQVKNVVLIGGRSSNNICGLAQLLIEHKMIPHVLTPPQYGAPLGNAFLSSLLLPKDRWHQLSRTEWKNVDQYAAEYARKLESSIVIPEGADLPAAYVGAKTLAEDIAFRCDPDHVFIDCGTGVQAKALIDAGKCFLPRTHFHVVLIAGSAFQTEKNVTFYRPSIGASFGSTPKAIFREIHFIAQEEGFFVDPIYTAKLFHTARAQKHLTGTVCIVHSGGGMSLFSHATAILETALNANTSLHNHM